MKHKTSFTIHDLPKPERPRERLENFWSEALSAQELLAFTSIRTLSSNFVHPREVFKRAILHSAASVVFAHNHPSGDSEPSEGDMTITRRLEEAGKILGIYIIYNIIITKNGFFQF